MKIDNISSKEQFYNYILPFKERKNMDNVLQTETQITNPVLTNERSALTSDKYKFQDSKEIIALLEGEGFTLKATSYGTPRKKDKIGFQKHVMVFTHPNLRIDRDNSFEILVTNSHDGTSSLKINLGIYRLVCANGLVIGSTFLERRIRHITDNFNEKVRDGLLSIVAQTDNVRKVVAAMKERKLTGMERIKLTELMANTRLKNTDTVLFERALQPQRSGDTEQNLYTLYNIMQEKLVRGGLEYASFDKDDNGENIVTMKRLRKITSIDTVNKVNKELWNIAEGMVA